MTDTWLAREQRRHNLDSFRHQPPEPVARLKPRHKFTEAQLRIARADFERRRKTA